MKIAQIAPIRERVLPRSYGGTGWVVARLIDGLIRLGHEVALFASGTPRNAAEPGGRGWTTSLDEGRQRLGQGELGARAVACAALVPALRAAPSGGRSRDHGA